MAERKYFEKNELMQMLEKVSNSLEKPVTCVLIGGLAMVHHQVKNTTKDIDLVFNDGKEIYHFIQTIKEMGFKRNSNLSDEYLDLKAHGIYFSEDGYMLDLFLSKVLDGFYLTKNILGRSIEMEISGMLNLSILSPVDIFLFKSITMRESDLADMAYLSPLIKDWNPFINELRLIKDDHRLVSRSYQRIQDLFNDYQIKIPLEDELDALCELATAKMAIIGVLQYESKKRDFLLKELDTDERSLIEKALNELIREGIVHIEKGSVSLIQQEG